MSKVKFKKPKDKKKCTHGFGHIRTKNYDCFFLFFPLIPIALLLDWLNNKYWKSLKWSDCTAEKVLNHYLPKMVEYDKEMDGFFIKAGWEKYRCVPLGYRKWYQKFNTELVDYLIKDYCPDGYIKTFENLDGWNPTLFFKEIKKSS